MERKQINTQPPQAQQTTEELRKRLKAARKLHQALVSSIGEGVILINEYGNITEVNRTALEMLGYNRAEVVGQWLQEILPSKDKDGNDVPVTERPALRALLTGRATREISTYVKKDGTVFPVAGTAAPYILDDRPRGAIIVFRDVSHDLAVERAKDEFVSLASHQLRTPLTSMRLYVDLIKSSSQKLNADNYAYITKIEAAALSMLELVDDFLSISKLELGELEIHREEFDVTDLINTQLERISSVAADNRIKLSTKDMKPVKLYSDKKLLGEAIYNLLTNAIRYRSQSHPAIVLSVIINPSTLSISIKDNGIGIAKEDQKKIFERLYRAANAVDTHSDGTGLGLYLVSKIVSALGGRISLESEVSKGSKFIIALPRAVAPVDKLSV